MEVVLSIDEYLKRQKEVFEIFTDKGREVDLLPLLNEYQTKDDEKYDIEEAYKYLNSYVTSLNITDEDLEKYKKVKEIDKKDFYKMGKKAVITLIDSNNDEKELYVLASLFAKRDGKVKPYSITFIKKAIEYYLNNTKDKSLVNTYNTVISLTKKNKKFDLSLIETVLKMENENEALFFLKSISISKSNLNYLIKTYCTLYPGNTNEINYLNELNNKLNTTKRNKLVPSKDELKITSSVKLKKLIETYLVTDVEDISDIENEYHMSEFEFNEALNEAIVGKNTILLSLIDKYKAKESVIKENRKNVIKSIGNAILNGVNYGTSYREFNTFDYFKLHSNLSMETILYEVDNLFSNKEKEIIVNKLETIDTSNKYKNKDVLYKTIGTFSKNGRNLKDKEKEKVIKYIVDQNWPLNNSLFFATCERYFDGDLILSE